MKSFVTHVHLKNAEPLDYDRLDQEMEKERFAPSGQVVKPAVQRADAGREYNFLGGVSIQAVTEAAYRAAHRTGKQYRFTVIRSRT